MNEQRPWVVLKFGGTSVSTVERWQTIAEVVRERVDSGYRVLLVCSALSQVSNRLEELLDLAANGEEVEDRIISMRQEHLVLARELDVTLAGGERVLADLQKLLQGVQLTHEVTPRLHARVLSSGEMMSTRLGAAFLERVGMEIVWQDARQLLEAEPVPDPRDPTGRPYLSATCDNAADPELRARLEAMGHDVVITQGFVASRDGETVLLGRGGSDTSAAYFAGLLSAERLEIWTDVPGMFTANPRKVTKARLLHRLPYREAEELAMRGGKVLHPRAIRAAENCSVPIHVCWTSYPESRGTIITDVETAGPGLKAVSARDGMVVVSMRVDADWQPIGLIADLTSAFKDHGLSIDLMASSPTNLTIALDLEANHRTVEDLDLLFEDLRKLCRPRLIESTAAISLVGSGIRALLHQWGEALQFFEDEEVYLLSQSANDRSVSFMVRDSRVDRLVSDIHDFVFGDASSEELGPRWSELVPEESDAPAKQVPVG